MVWSLILVAADGGIQVAAVPAGRLPRARQ
jgi:hypothetical protein